MMWMDYNITQAGENWSVQGDWPGEVMGLDKQGNPGFKERPLYKPGDVFIVNNSGWLIKTDEVNALLLKHENSQKEQPQLTK